MRIDRGDATDLGMLLSCLTVGAIDENDVSSWASRAIDEEIDPPMFLYFMLDLKQSHGKRLREEIGFEPGRPDLLDIDYHYLRQIGVRRGLERYSYLGPAAEVVLPPDRKKFIDDLFMHNFGIVVDDLPPLSSFKVIE